MEFQLYSAISLFFLCNSPHKNSGHMTQNMKFNVKPSSGYVSFCFQVSAPKGPCCVTAEQPFVFGCDTVKSPGSTQLLWFALIKHPNTFCFLLLPSCRFCRILSSSVLGGGGRKHTFEKPCWKCRFLWLPFHSLVITHAVEQQHKPASPPPAACFACRPPHSLPAIMPCRSNPQSIAFRIHCATVTEVTVHARKRARCSTAVLHISKAESMWCLVTRQISTFQHTACVPVLWTPAFEQFSCAPICPAAPLIIYQLCC